MNSTKVTIERTLAFCRHPLQTSRELCLRTHGANKWMSPHKSISTFVLERFLAYSLLFFRRAGSRANSIWAARRPAENVAVPQANRRISESHRLEFAGHSRKHSRYYGSAKPRAADRFESTAGFPERRISRNPRVYVRCVIRFMASHPAATNWSFYDWKRDVRNIAGDATRRTGEINRTQMTSS